MRGFKNGETVQVLLSGDWHKADYVGISGDSHVVKCFAYQAVGEDRIRKESPSFKDVEIDWRDGEAWIDSELIAFEGDLSQLCIGGTTSNGWALSGYLIDGYDEVYRTPMLFNTNGTEVKLKATHARFVKIN